MGLRARRFGLKARALQQLGVITLAKQTAEGILRIFEVLIHVHQTSGTEYSQETSRLPNIERPTS